MKELSDCYDNQHCHYVNPMRSILNTLNFAISGTWRFWINLVRWTLLSKFFYLVFRLRVWIPDTTRLSGRQLAGGHKMSAFIRWSLAAKATAELPGRNEKEHCRFCTLVCECFECETSNWKLPTNCSTLPLQSHDTVPWLQAPPERPTRRKLSNTAYNWKHFTGQGAEAAIFERLINIHSVPLKNDYLVGKGPTPSRTLKLTNEIPGVRIYIVVCLNPDQLNNIGCFWILPFY